MSGVTTKPYLSNAPWIARSKNFPPSPSCNGSRIATQGICWTWQWEIRIFILLTPNPRKLTSMQVDGYMYTHLSIHVYVCMYVYIYIERERDWGFSIAIIDDLWIGHGLQLGLWLCWSPSWILMALRGEMVRQYVLADFQRNLKLVMFYPTRLQGGAHRYVCWIITPLSTHISAWTQQWDCTCVNQFSDSKQEHPRVLVCTGTCNFVNQSW